MDKKFFYALIACMLFTLGLQFAYQKFFPHAAAPFKSQPSAVTPGGSGNCAPTICTSESV